MATKPLGVFLAAHKQDTGLKYWEFPRWQQEIAVLRAMGANTVWILPI